MAESRRLDLMGLTLFLAVTAAAFLVRAWYVNTCDAGNHSGPLMVQSPDPHLEELVRHVHQGEGFVLADSAGKLQPWAGSEPLYPYVVASVQAVDDAADPYRQVRWLQAGLGALAAGLLSLCCYVAFQSRLTAIVAGVLASLHPFWVVETTALSDGTLAVFLMAAVLAFGVLGSRRQNAISALLFGLALG
ncbi:MAG: phospholipid carrier-dependent glycosyltransferase, partial [Gemmataceae bacterium]